MSLIVAAAVLAPGCGEGERRFDAGSFVDELNAKGAGLRLGEPLQTTQDDTQVYDVILDTQVPTGAGAEPRHQEGGEGGHEEGGGSLTIAPDTAAATARYAECEETVNLVCYRAANAVLVIQDSAAPVDLARVTAAVSALETE